MFSIYWIQVEVKLKHPLMLIDEKDQITDEEIKSALMEFGVTAKSEFSVKSIIKDFISSYPSFDELEYEIVFERIGVIDDVEGEVYGDPDIADSLIQPPTDYGMWYHTRVGWCS